MKATVTGKYDQVEFSPDYPPLAFQINSMGTGIGRAAWSTGDEAQYQTSAFTITETDQSFCQAIQPEPINLDARSLLNDAIDRICTEEGKKVLRANRPTITETDGASDQ